MRRWRPGRRPRSLRDRIPALAALSERSPASRAGARCRCSAGLVPRRRGGPPCGGGLVAASSGGCVSGRGKGSSRWGAAQSGRNGRRYGNGRTRDRSGAERTGPARDRPTGVVLFADTFGRWFDPQTLRAAVKVLGAAGYAVETARPAAGNGRSAAGAPISPPAWSTGPRRRRERTIAALMPHVGRARRRRAGAILHPHAARRVSGAGAGRRGEEAGGALVPLVEEFLAAEAEGGAAGAAAEADRPPGVAARPLPPEGLRRHGGGGAARCG